MVLTQFTCNVIPMKNIHVIKTTLFCSNQFSAMMSQCGEKDEESSGSAFSTRECPFVDVNDFILFIFVMEKEQTLT